MTGARVVSPRRFTPSMDASDATIPTPTPAPSEWVVLAARLVTAKARSDADRLLILAALGVTE